MEKEPTKKQLEEREQEIFSDQDPLEESERAIRLMGEQDRDEEEALEEEELVYGEERDVIKDIPGMDGNKRVIPPADLMPEGMEGVVRGAPGEGDEEDVRTAEDDEETGGD